MGTHCRKIRPDGVWTCTLSPVYTFEHARRDCMAMQAGRDDAPGRCPMFTWLSI
jgi:hypothetical protein